MREQDDIADSPLASYWPDMARELDSVEDCAREVCHEAAQLGYALAITVATSLIAQTIERSGGTLLNVNAHELIERVASFLLDSSNPRRDTDVLAFTSGLYARLGVSQTELANKHGVTRASFSKRCKNLQEKLGLPPSRGMKSEKACKTYAKTNGKL